ncbi:glycosyltransferase [Flavobacterium sp. UBA6135]|uniref:glycosyltransferase n=1 Tax=Flavobacterium sp. UBA6135 TaxID=1946553 RepID=UPI0025B95913|nr:glycosyltransferase [Flavobacterium sp. UBA6135]
MDFKHYLITRFNLRNKKWDVTKNNESLLTDQWMNHRMELFENYCLPSVKSQNNKNFTWLLFFDITTSDVFKNWILNTTKDTNFIQCFFIDGMDSFSDSIKEFIAKDASSFTHIITSRIDNDDCVSKFYIDEIQKQFNFQKYLAVDFVSGYTLSLNPVMLGKKEQIYNPFISLIEENKNPKTVWHNDHNQWKKEKSIINIENKRVWLSIIHDKNKVNEFYGFGNIFWDSLENEFIISDKINKEIKSKIIPQKKWLLLSLKNEWHVRFKLLSKKIKKIIGLYKLKKILNLK